MSGIVFVFRDLRHGVCCLARYHLIHILIRIRHRASKNFSLIFSLPYYSSQSQQILDYFLQIIVDLYYISCTGSAKNLRKWFRHSIAATSSKQNRLRNFRFLFAVVACCENQINHSFIQSRIFRIFLYYDMTKKSAIA